MKKSKTFAEAVMAGAAAVALVGLVYAGGKSNTVDLMAEQESSHTITFDKSYSNRPASTGVTQLSDSSFGLHNGGYIVADFEGTDNVTNTQSKLVLFSATANEGTGSGNHSLYLSIDLYANNITSASFAGGTNSGSTTNYQTVISLYANNHTNHSSSESALKSSTAETTITNGGISGSANHVHYQISDQTVITKGLTIYFTSVSVTFAC